MIQVDATPRARLGEIPVISSGIFESVLSPMDFPQFDFSKTQLKDVSRALRIDLPFGSDEEQQRALDVFAVANAWRDSHVYPMTVMRRTLAAQVRKSGVHAVTAARVKQMRSIRKKVREQTIGIDRMQDLGGCRVIVTTMAQVDSVAAMCLKAFPHDFVRQKDYTREIKELGYRSNHMIYRFRPRDDEEEVFDGRFIELQIRTRLQHSWATAAEAIGVFRNEDFKHGEGDPKWLRLLRLVAEEFALTEGCIPHETMTQRKQRVAEIRDLDQDIDALRTLESVNVAFRSAEGLKFAEKAKYLVITQTPATGQVSVRGFDDPKMGAAHYDTADRMAVGGMNSVLVQVDHVENLQAAYPNYFGDVKVFTDNLRRITKGKAAQEFALPKPQVVRQIRPQPIDLGWLRRSRFR
jgi:ppGpp synthetase/RelA/SpoT-type nucleotidyltranferase